MKKKIMALCLVIALLATAIAGATLAYFTDNDAQANVFTVGNVAIDLYEDFGDNNAATLEKLVPATFDENNKRQNEIEKEIYVTNTGSEDAFVRIHFAIPQVLDNGDPDFDASANIVHWNFWNYGNKQWNWTPDANEAGYVEGDWNFYEDTIDGVAYNVYVATYETALEKDDKTPFSVYKVYMDPSVTNEDITAINEVLVDGWKIYVIAEGVQAEGFADAYTALNEAFGEPGSYTVDWKATAKGETLVDKGDIGAES